MGDPTQGYQGETGGATTAAGSSQPTAPAAPAYLANGEGEKVNKSGYTKPDAPACPNCGIGIMIVTAWDENATHEIGTPIYFPRNLSGGSVAASCFNCGFTETVPMDPQEAPPNPTPGS